MAGKPPKFSQLATDLVTHQYLLISSPIPNPTTPILPIQSLLHFDDSTMSLTAYLPQSPGYLPPWLLLVHPPPLPSSPLPHPPLTFPPPQISTLALGNCLQSYLTLHFTTQVYNGPSSPPPTSPSTKTAQVQVTPLQSRTFGTWTLLSSLIRIYAAYNITNKPVYQIALWSYVVAEGHFMSEWLWFGTAAWGRGLAGPVIVANVSLVWMVLGMGYYLE